MSAKSVLRINWLQIIKLSHGKFVVRQGKHKEFENKSLAVFEIKDAPCTLCAHFDCWVHGF